MSTNFQGCIEKYCTAAALPGTPRCSAHAAYDSVAKPKHYNSHPSGIECITIAQHHNFNVGNVFKYLWRCGLKDGEDETEALKKAARYLAFEIARVEKTNG